MSVYTTVKRSELEHFLLRYDIGQLLDYRAISAGITNTNYYLDTDKNQYVLTLYEHHNEEQLNYILGLQQHLSSREVACSYPIVDRHACCFSTLHNRPAAINHRVYGEVEPVPGLEHCLLVGRELARFHLAGQDYQGYRPNPRGFDWWSAMRGELGQQMSANELKLLDQNLDDYHKAGLEGLPAGPIHADLFHDNVLYHQQDLAGIIDFDYACNDYFIFDIAIVLNDWCAAIDGRLGNNRVQALLTGYQQVRTLLDQEKQLLPLMLRVAALRFWLSRLYDQTYPLEGEHTFIKCPDVYRDLLMLRSETGTLAP
jgi:homoserine kinase type II